MVKDHDLDALRDRQDFEKLVHDPAGECTTMARKKTTKSALPWRS
jgi:hypothetical protein